jgi:hypothetical protein
MSGAACKETDLNLSASSFSHLPVRYEQLRQQRLDGVFTRAINVFVQKGMCGWTGQEIRLHFVSRIIASCSTTCD